MLKPCIVCGTPTPSTRCPACETGHQRRRGSSTQRGYDYQWRKLSRQRITEHVAEHGLWCPGYGVPAHQVTSGRDLSTDHVRPIAASGRNERANTSVLCIPCNSRKRDRR